MYDGDGNRVQKIVAGVTTKYLVATVNPTGYPQVVYQTFSGTGITEYWRQFVYGLDRISQYRSTQSGTQKSFYVYDGHGSVRALTDGSGNVTDTYDYDAFGNVTHQTGTTPNEFLFAGEQYDSNLHLYYNRARYLNVSTGRFWSMDTFEGDPEAPLSLHEYLYAEGDPITNLDPAGHQIDDLIGSAIGSALNNISAIQGQAVMDQVRYGGSAGLKALFLSGVIIGGAIAIEGFGSIAREMPLLKAASSGVVIANEMKSFEVEFAEEVVAFRGGTFVGQTVEDTAGIDGFLDGDPASLKVLSTNSVQTVLDRLQEARDEAADAGYFGVELFVSAKNIRASALLAVEDSRGAIVRATIESYPRQGILKTVNILTADGWLRFVP